MQLGMPGRSSHSLEWSERGYFCTACGYTWKRRPYSACPGVPASAELPPGFWLTGRVFRRLRIDPPARPTGVVWRRGSTYPPRPYYSVDSLPGPLPPVLRRRIVLEVCMFGACTACFSATDGQLVRGRFFCSACVWRSGHWYYGREVVDVREYLDEAPSSLWQLFTRNVLLDPGTVSEGLFPILSLWEAEAAACLAYFQEWRAEALLDAVVDAKPEDVEEFDQAYPLNEMEEAIEAVRQEVRARPVVASKPDVDLFAAALRAASDYRQGRDDGRDPFAGGFPPEADFSVLVWFCNWVSHRRLYRERRPATPDWSLEGQLDEWLRLAHWSPRLDETTQGWLVSSSKSISAPKLLMPSISHTRKARY